MAATTVSLARRATRTLREYGILVALAVMIVVVQSINSNFISTDNLLNIGDQWAPTMIMAAAMTFVLIGGGFDLSVGATLALSATLSASFLEHQPPGVAFAAVIAVGSGLLALYFTNPVWGSPADYLKALLWGSTVSEGLKYVNILLHRVWS